MRHASMTSFDEVQTGDPVVGDVAYLRVLCRHYHRHRAVADTAGTVATRPDSVGCPAEAPADKAAARTVLVGDPDCGGAFRRSDGGFSANQEVLRLQPASGGLHISPRNQNRPLADLDLGGLRSHQRPVRRYSVR